MRSEWAWVFALPTGVLLLGFLLLWAASGCAVRAPKSNGMRQVSVVESGELGLQQVEGEVLRIDPEAGTLTIQEEEGTLELKVTEDTSVFLQGGVSSLAEIVEGHPIRAAFSVEGLEKIATWVEVPRELPAEGEETPEAAQPPPGPAEPVGPAEPGDLGNPTSPRGSPIAE